jgi:hypothetical protein
MKLISFLNKLIIRTPEQKARALEMMKVTRFEVFKGVITKLPPHLQPVPGSELTPLFKSIAEQVNYATASTQFVGSDEEMRQKLEALVAELRRNGAEKAARELIGAVKMRPHYLDQVKSITTDQQLAQQPLQQPHRLGYS